MYQCDSIISYSLRFYHTKFYYIKYQFCVLLIPKVFQTNDLYENHTEIVNIKNIITVTCVIFIIRFFISTSESYCHFN